MMASWWDITDHNSGQPDFTNCGANIKWQEYSRAGKLWQGKTLSGTFFRAKKKADIDFQRIAVLHTARIYQSP
jgi:hypothetical protein